MTRVSDRGLVFSKSSKAATNPPMEPITLAQAIRRIGPADVDARRRAEARQLGLTKPPGSLGRLEQVSVQLAGIFGTEKPRIRGKTVIVAAADHGVVAQGVTGYPQAVTGQMVQNFLEGGAAVSALSKLLGVRQIIVDAGVASGIQDHPGLRRLSAGRGTDDITLGPAMSARKAEQCLTAGVNLAVEAARSGADLIATGDMGIGNTTAASAIAATVTGKSARETTGSGTGRTPEELEHKVEVVQRALAVNRPHPMAPPWMCWPRWEDSRSACWPVSFWAGRRCGAPWFWTASSRDRRRFWHTGSAPPPKTI